MVLPCMGSQTQSGVRPSRFTARKSGGRAASIRSAPKRQISVSRPGSPSGSRMPIRRMSSSGLSVGPHLRPIGFLTPRQYSTCAPPGWRVRSPIQTRWPEVA